MSVRGLASEVVPLLEATGLVVSGYADDGTVETVELPEHRFFLATLFQPQVSPDEGELHPLLSACCWSGRRVRVAGIGYGLLRRGTGLALDR